MKLLRLLIVFLLLSISCRKVAERPDPIPQIPTSDDLVSTVNTNVTGNVTNEWGDPLADVSVVAGSTSTTTDKYGFFSIKNVQLIKNAAFITMELPGYIKITKTFIAQNTGTYFRIMLIRKIDTGPSAVGSKNSFNSASSGSLTAGDETAISFEANSLINAATNIPYNGIATITLIPTLFLNPYNMPGDYRGLDSKNQLKMLSQFAVSGMSLISSTGDALQIAPNKKATLSLPIYDNLSNSLFSSSPDSISLWYFDEKSGLWKEDGIAYKIGKFYVGSISHIASFWSCSVPVKYNNFDCTFVDSSGHPMADAQINISVVGSNLQNEGKIWTDSNGHVSGTVPQNVQLQLELAPWYTYQYIPVYSQTFTSGTSDVSLGTIAIDTKNLLTLTGHLIDCNNNPVTNGFVIFNHGRTAKRIPVTNGNFTIINVKPAGGECDIIGVDYNTNTTSDLHYFSAVYQNRDVGTISTCGLAPEVFINYSINDTAFTVKDLSAYIGYDLMPPNAASNIIVRHDNVLYDDDRNIIFSYTYRDMSLNSTQKLTSFFARKYSADTLHIVSPIDVHITEYGVPGQYISGNFSGILTGPPPANMTYNVTCNFRILRGRYF